MEESHLQLLRQFLSKLPTREVPIEMQPELVRLLKYCWDMFIGSDQEGMEAYKLERIEKPRWDPPLLEFMIERHGGMVLGSSRAERQCWSVDLDRKIAEYNVIGYRQLYPRAAPVDVEPIADELVELITKHRQDERIRWSKDGRVQILSERIFPTGSASKQTIEGRRSRLSKAIEERLTQHGWQRRQSWWERKGNWKSR